MNAKLDNRYKHLRNKLDKARWHLGLMDVTATDTHAVALIETLVEVVEALVTEAENAAPIEWKP